MSYLRCGFNNRSSCTPTRFIVIGPQVYIVNFTIKPTPVIILVSGKAVLSRAVCVSQESNKKNVAVPRREKVIGKCFLKFLC